MSVAVQHVDHRDHGGGFAQKMRAQAAGGGAELMRTNMLAAGEVSMASQSRLQREIKAKALVRYRLRSLDGAYVNLDLSGEVHNPLYAWIGFKHQLEAVRRKRPDLADFEEVTVDPDRRRDAVQVKLGAGRGVMG